MVFSAFQYFFRRMALKRLTLHIFVSTLNYIL